MSQSSIVDSIVATFSIEKSPCTTSRIDHILRTICYLTTIHASTNTLGKRRSRDITKHERLSDELITSIFEPLYDTIVIIIAIA